MGVTVRRPRQLNRALRGQTETEARVTDPREEESQRGAWGAALCGGTHTVQETGQPSEGSISLH